MTHACNKVFVLDTNKKQLNPLELWKARDLLKRKLAAVFRQYPLTIILKRAAKASELHAVKALTVKQDPGSKHTGLAVVDHTNTVVFAMELEHRGQAIKADLLSRRQIRVGRRSRNTRYRKARFDNRTGVAGGLPPSLMSRIHNIMTWVNRFRKYANITSIQVESVSFDTQKMSDPAIKGKQYQQGLLQGTTPKLYLMKKHNCTCVYCGAKDVPMQIEHILAKTNGGTNALYNLTLACNRCNQAKGSRLIEDYLASQPALLATILQDMEASRADAAAVNSTSKKLLELLKATGLLVTTALGFQTKSNRQLNCYPKAHWIDAACVGDSGSSVRLNPNMQILHAKATGCGNRHLVRVDKYGFPRTKLLKDGTRVRVAPKHHKTIASPVGLVKTGDVVQAHVGPSSKYAGVYQARITAVKTKVGFFSIKLRGKQIDLSSSWITSLFHLNDGYSYEAYNAS